MTAHIIFKFRAVARAERARAPADLAQASDPDTVRAELEELLLAVPASSRPNALRRAHSLVRDMQQETAAPSAAPTPSDPGRRPAVPVLVIIAGPNGSGKATLVNSGALSRIVAAPVQSINADNIARAMTNGAQPTDAQSLLAAQIADKLLDLAIAERRSVMVETVLSSDKYKHRVVAAKSAIPFLAASKRQSRWQLHDLSVLPAGLLAAIGDLAKG